MCYKCSDLILVMFDLIWLQFSNNHCFKIFSI